MKIICAHYLGFFKIQENIYNFLGEKELFKFNRMESGLRNDWLCGRLALKQAYLINYSLPNNYAPNITIDNLPNGQPYITNHNKLYCSIAHSNNRGIGAISNIPIGIDIEKVKPRKKHLVEYIADKNEIEFYKLNYKNPSELITVLWTIKEAVLKGLGEGFNFPPKNIKIRKLKNNTSTVEVLNKKELWNVTIFKIEEFFISIAYPEGIEYNERNEKIEISWLDPTRL